MLQTLKNAWNTKEIRKKILFTLFILLLFRIGTVIPVPYVEANRLSDGLNGTILQYMDMLSGGALAQMTLFALGVQPYINASIIIQLLAVVFPKLGEIAKEDKKKMTAITRIVTLILAVVTAIGYYFMILNGGALTKPATEGSNAWLYGIVIVACYTAGATLVMWLAERINDNGIGNGISLILFAGIISEVPHFVYSLIDFVKNTFGYVESPALYASISTLFAILLVAFLLALIAFVIYITGSERRIPVQYAKKVVGRKMYGGQSSNLPIKLNMTGVMPIIFASSIVSFVPTIVQILANAKVLSLVNADGSNTGWGNFMKIIGTDGIIYPVLTFILIIAFAYFYTQITFNPIEVANNLKKQGGAIPGIRQGRSTADYIKKILNKITLAGALFLAFIALLPMILGPHAFKYFFEWVYGAGEGSLFTSMAVGDTAYVFSGYELLEKSEYVSALASNLTGIFTFGGTTLLIVVGVAIETFREIEAQLTMRNYKGFLN